MVIIHCRSRCSFVNTWPDRNANSLRNTTTSNNLGSLPVTDSQTESFERQLDTVLAGRQPSNFLKTLDLAVQQLVNQDWTDLALLKCKESGK